MVITNTYMHIYFCNYIYVHIYLSIVHIYMFKCMHCLLDRTFKNVKGGTATTVEFALNLTAAMGECVCLAFSSYLQ